MKPTPTVLIQFLTCCGETSRLTPAVSKTSALPELLLMERLPCFATLAPAAATTNALAVETLKILAPSPPVPQVSTRSSDPMSTGVARLRITWAAAVISVIVSPFICNAIRKPPICDGVALPVMICCITAVICCDVKSCLFTRSLRAFFISMLNVES